MSNETSRPRKLPSVQEMCVSVPLYEKFSFEENDWQELVELRYYRGHIDAFCAACKQDAIFKPSNAYTGYKSTDATKDGVFSLWFGCARSDNHKMFFCFWIDSFVLQKVGQFPSIADTSQSSLRKYRTVLSRSDYSELNRAVGLVAHGVGIGAFVYLRRIFERLVEAAHTRALASVSWDEDAYARSRMDERIVRLKHELPEFLIDNRSLYGILSKGIHELSEDECLGAFPIVRLGIELILDAEIEIAERKRKMRDAEKSISSLRSKLT